MTHSTKKVISDIFFSGTITHADTEKLNVMQQNHPSTKQP